MKNILHRIKVYLYKNTLTGDSNDYLARVRAEKTVDIKAVCHSAVKRGRANVVAPAMQYAVECKPSVIPVF